MANSNSPDYRALSLQAEEEWKHAEEQRRHAEEEHRRAEEGRRHAEEGRRHQRRGADVQRTVTYKLPFPKPSRSTKGAIQPPKGKYFPTKLLPWVDLPAKQHDIYTSVCNYLAPAGGAEQRSFPPIIALEEISRRVSRRPLSSERDLETYERLAVEDHLWI
ncbi:hypothetical protein ACO22_06809 [Paracoccidioides brasiliensis]|uniref:Uncharacterized protein n=1 Tax=Paracoccidioides brasiliensis TaxID=121759 RepID=A0A1D2J6F0_PARBR|nr:hypothetical protein ACO22_06809 [Paracoccidioides brasiliensis]